MNFPMVALSQVVSPISRVVEVIPGVQYRTIGVKLWGEGAYERETIDGTQTAAKTLTIVKANDLIINKIWVRNGSTAVASQDVDGCAASGEFPIFELDQTQIIPRWLHWLTKTKSFWQKCDELSRGTSGKNRIKPDLFLTIEIPLPPLEEQRRIVARIEEMAAKIEEARRLRREAVEETKDLSISYLSGLFAYPLFDKLPPQWKWKSLDDLLINRKSGMITGPFGTLLQKSDIQPDGIPILGIANVQKNKFLPGFSDYISVKKAKELSTYEVCANDIVVARSGTVGRSCVVPLTLYPNPVMSTNLIRLRLDENKFLPELLCKLFNGSSLIERYKNENCYGSTRAFFTQRMLLNLQIPTPPIEEQEQIIINLNRLQAQIDLLERCQVDISEELNALLPSILDKAFKGEL
ncbi:restriction endonuclease subunit S [Tengunoibacter tsumagoiensis]|uniref:Type I restriction modification DNA specificity domain-containing protein n=1 Tax=Tengunoibacter tsumagoiensis TaxID=2014871 RepID=A0A402A064_9CHLR|nr:restriction endonuclease subunit S [Tengunoibacter tsumagoiensis]GCE12485.1 hypothetical protein KTT_23440 [Tengunoibacter tsumagoiensis]